MGSHEVTGHVWTHEQTGATTPATELIRQWDSLVVQEHVVVEAVLNGGAVAEASSVHLLHGFSQDVGTGVPVHLRVGGGAERRCYCPFLLVSAVKCV